MFAKNSKAGLRYTRSSICCNNNDDDDNERIWKEVRTQPTLTLKRLSINQLINKTNSRPNERKKNPKNERERERERNREIERERERNRERERERQKRDRNNCFKMCGVNVSQSRDFNAFLVIPLKGFRCRSQSVLFLLNFHSSFYVPSYLGSYNDSVFPFLHRCTYICSNSRSIFIC